VEIVLAPPQPSLGLVLQDIHIPVICQHVDNAGLGSTTGYFSPEMAKSFGAIGSLINHSEHRLNIEMIESLVKRLHNLDMTSIVCAASSEEVARIASFKPNFIAIEPPELIGSGKAVSKERPSVIADSVSAATSNYSKPPKVICGAGITDKEDVSSAYLLGAQGILVASGVIKAGNWYDKIAELASGFSIA
jgi:triosephosphate isomerase